MTAKESLDPILPAIDEKDPRWDLHYVCVGAGFAVDRSFESIAGLRVYRKSNGEAVDVFLNESWGRYDSCACWVAGGHGSGALRARFEFEVARPRIIAPTPPRED